MENKDVIQRTNKIVLIINSTLSSFLAIGYVLEYFKGQRTLQYIAFFIMIVYTIAITTSHSQLAFVYVFPIMVMYLLYFDMKLTLYSYSYIFALNTGVIIYKVLSGVINALHRNNIIKR